MLALRQGSTMPPATPQVNREASLPCRKGCDQRPPGAGRGGSVAPNAEAQRRVAFTQRKIHRADSVYWGKKTTATRRSPKSRIFNEAPPPTEDLWSL